MYPGVKQVVGVDQNELEGVYANTLGFIRSDQYVCNLKLDYANERRCKIFSYIDYIVIDEKGKKKGWFGKAENRSRLHVSLYVAGIEINMSPIANWNAVLAYRVKNTVVGTVQSNYTTKNSENRQKALGVDSAYRRAAVVGFFLESHPFRLLMLEMPNWQIRS